jgi:hypothetical protein
LNVFDDSIFVNIAFVVNVEFAECILKSENIALRELRIFPRAGVSDDARKEGKWRGN